ncbi:hypothetical protein OC834_006287 [Tilletia horrida]|uniref:Extracellular membrane protein CFEM domain-containing protein n=1 Tax=Tilletia horrida TaxID=155126 RepID=A0AAN6JK49_9BASI|nr:hypothetical protein OC834_006287 [Tilletia horrida]KAK0529544.1 hypothetical protein OC842_004208 [Tilletia horrida]KAK0567683.1 hypothetical protein OC844_000135 [Tilletia horrida]
MLVKSVFVLAASAALTVATAVQRDQPEPRLFGAPSKPTGTPPPGYGFSNKGCFDFFECLFSGEPQGVKCVNMQCVTPLGSGTVTKTSTSPGSTPLPSGVPAGYSPVAGRKCFDAFDCLLGDFQDTKQKCVKGQCYSNKA